MESEIKNILSGKLNKTIEFESNKKILGVPTKSFVSRSEEISPLKKQGAFEEPAVVENNEIESFDDAIGDLLTSTSTTSEPQVSVPVTGNTLEAPTSKEIQEEKPQVANKFILESDIPSPKEDEGITLENPVETASLNTLTSLAAPAEVTNENIEIPSEKIEENNDIGALDIQLPKMPDEITAEMPSESDPNLFVDPVVNNVEEKRVEGNVSSPQIDLNVNNTEEIKKVEVPTNENIEPVTDLLVEEPIKEEIKESNNAPVLPQNDETITQSEIIDIDSIVDKMKQERMENINSYIKIQMNEFASDIVKLVSEKYDKGIVEKEKNDNVIASEPLNNENDSKLIDEALNQINNMVIPAQDDGGILLSK